MHIHTLAVGITFSFKFPALCVFWLMPDCVGPRHIFQDIFEGFFYTSKCLTKPVFSVIVCLFALKHNKLWTNFSLFQLFQTDGVFFLSFIYNQTTTQNIYCWWHIICHLFVQVWIEDSTLQNTPLSRSHCHRNLTMDSKICLWQQTCQDPATATTIGGLLLCVTEICFGMNILQSQYRQRPLETHWTFCWPLAIVSLEYNKVAKRNFSCGPAWNLSLNHT